MGKEMAMPMHTKQILPPTIGLERRSGSAASGSGSGAGRQHKLKQRFTVLRKLGKGTYGKVQLAVNKETGQEVAIKTIKKTKIENEQDLERVRREIQIMSSIEHPHIVHIYEVFENKDKIVLIMQYAPGGELYEYVSQSKVLDEVEARRLFRQVATAIYYCHKNKICHRDLKLENILLDEKNNAKLADFGLSNVFDKSRQLKTFCGSPLYASPEIVQGSPYEGPEVDCWSLGVLLYTLVYGAMPFDGSNFKRLVKQISEASYYEPKQRSEASPLISRLLCADPLKRATILDICQDPWVNGYHSLVPPSLPSTPNGGQQRPASPPATSPNRLEPQQQQQQQQQAHTSLLKVAQDMANLTPVRLDILLALTPAALANSETAPPRGPKQGPAPARVPKRKASLQEDEAAKTNRQRQQQERQTKLMDQLDGTGLMEVDENRATSPVASYRVRDLAAESDTRSGDTVKSRSDDGTDAPAAETGQEEEEEASRRHADDERDKTAEQDGAGAQIEMDVGAMREDTEAEPGETKQSVIVIGGHVCDKEPRGTESTGTSEAHNDSQAASNAESELKEMETRQRAFELQIGVPENGQAEMVSSPTMVAPHCEVLEAPKKETTEEPETVPKDEPLHPENIQPPEAEAEKGRKEDGDEGASKDSGTTSEGAKAKKVKKKIIVVKKRKKVVKKEAGGEQESAEGTGSKDKEKATDSKKGSISTNVPGKVRIPDTFQPTGEPDTPTCTLSRASRRQSALIADVSEKLLRQSQHPPSTAAIEEDQRQLANVRVLDKKSDFERCASLATNQQQQQTSGSISPRASHDAAATGEPYESQAEIAHHEPELIQSRLETTRVAEPMSQTIVEPVNKSEAFKTEHLQPIGRAESIQELVTQAAALSASGSLAQAEGERTDALDRNLTTKPNEDRSDSAETIRAETTEDRFQERLSARQANVRSSLQINLGSAGQQLDETFAQRRSPGSLAGPAPIARSYKKVTFTKDGSCVTETGRIYSTQDDDGTMRRIERKSKVTHYPSEGGSGGRVGAQSAVEETHEEIVYEDGAGFWPSGSHHSRPGKLQRERPLERLIMPSSEYYEEAEDDRDQMSHDSSQPFMERMDSASSCSSGSTDVFDDIFDTWTGAISMFSRRSNRRLSNLRDTLMNGPVGSATPALARQQQCASSSLFKQQHIGSSQAGTAQVRCGSVEPPRASMFDACFDGSPRPRRHHHHHRHRRHRHATGSSGRSSVEASGYESDAPIDRPASAAAGTRQTLGSARGMFGSSNLGAGLPRHRPSGATESLFDESLAAPDADYDDLFESLNRGAAALDPFGGSLLMQQIQLEQAKMRRRMAQQRNQFWKSSSPALNEIPSHDLASGPVCIEQRFVRSRADSSSSGRQAQERHSPARTHQQAGRLLTTVYKTLQHQPSGQPSQLNQSQSSGGMQRSIRQSAPLDSAPTQRNTANLSDHLPPRQPVNVRRSTSKTSSLTAQMANLQIGNHQQVQSSSADGQRLAAAGFIELKRNCSSSSSNQHGGAALRQEPGASCSAGSSSVFCEAPPTPSTGHSNISNSLSNRLAQQMVAASGQQDTEANNRIQSWLQQSAGNLSVSSGSKSSASDTLPSSGRSDAASSMLRGDGSMGTSATSVSAFSGQQRRQSRLEAGSSPLHHLPPIASARSLASTARQALLMSNTAAPQAASSAASMTVRSSSRHSASALSRPTDELEANNQSELREERHKAEERIVSVSVGGVTEIEDSSELFASHSTSSNMAQASSHSTMRFAFPADESGEQKVARKQQVVSTKQRLITHRVMSPLMTSGAAISAEAWLQQPQQAAPSGPKQSFIDDGFADDFDSLAGSGAELDSISSSSLLDQLRARGYRSMINQRMVNTQQSQQQQQQLGQQSAQSHEITASSTSITMSSSAVGGAQAEQEGVGGTSSSATRQQRPQANEPVAQLITNGHLADEQQQRQQAKQPQQDASLPPNAPPASNGPTNESGSVNEHSVGPACETGCERAARAAANSHNHHGSLVEDERGLEEDEDEDERAAKETIKGHLDRMREMETFLESMHEEEVRFQKQRQDMFLFNNLLLSAKLVGLKSMNTFEPALSDSFQVGPTRGHSSAPIGCGYGAIESASSNGFLAAVRPPKQSASGPQYQQQSGAVAAPAISCPSSNLCRAYISVPPAAAPRACSPLPAPDYWQDPLLEPVQPLQLAYHPPIGMPADRNRWRRSKSQLSDQFRNSTLQPSNTATRTYSGMGSFKFSPPAASSRRPVSANMDSMAHLAGLSSSAYSPSRQRRSASQMRGTSVMPASMGHESEVMSEYRSSFGPNLSHRSARSPMRLRATSPHMQVAVQRASGKENGNGRGNELELDDDMRDYRASNYVPKVVPAECASTRRGRSLSRRTSTLELGATLGCKSSPANSYCETALEPSNERRKSLQTTTSGLRVDFGERPSSPVTSRRRSVAACSEPLQGVDLDNSRLSELEQRIQANKRRRQELLSGINNAPARGSLVAPNGEQATIRVPLGAAHGDESGADASALERPSGRAAQSASRPPGGDSNSAPSSTGSGGSGSPKSRPSRLESMEARIKRRSYCVRVSSPERTRAKSSRAAPIASERRTSVANEALE